MVQRNSIVAPVAAQIIAPNSTESLGRSEGHPLVADTPYQSPAQRESVCMPTSPTREAALTSHPIVAESDGSEQGFETPDSERVSQRGGLFEKR